MDIFSSALALVTSALLSSTSGPPVQMSVGSYFVLHNYMAAATASDVSFAKYPILDVSQVRSPDIIGALELS